MAICVRPGPIPVTGPGREAVAPEMVTDAATDTTTDEKVRAVAPQARYLVIAAFVIVAGGFAGTLIYDHWAKAVSFKAPQGVGIFALFYIMAQIIERVQEPFVPYLGWAKDPAEKGKGKVQEPAPAKAELEKAVVAEFGRPEQPKEDSRQPAPERTVADKERTTDQIRANLTVLLFGTSALLAMIMSGYLKADLLQSVGESGIPHGWTSR